jgi:hypothetical protein
MTSIPTTPELGERAGPLAAATGWERFWEVVETRLAALAERANPILVKETRQALKSRQFVVTFLVVLVACWIVSFAGVALIGPQIYYAAAGGEMLVAYYAILAFPLAVIVPYTAFRSLASEQEENTYDLLSITSLTSKQIITGKLWSAVVQMLVYLSAVSPCIAFTFLLRGVDVLSTALLLGAALLGSLGLSMFSLFVGASSRVKHTQIVTSVGLVLALFGAFWGAIGLAVVTVYEGVDRDPELWIVLFVLATIYVTTFGLLHAAAAAQISFASENRSTPLRRWMMAQQACFIGGLAGMAYVIGDDWRAAAELNEAGFLMAAAYWYAMGALMTSEWPHLSRRVQRSLPQSDLGRMFLSFFNPGPGAGYMFAVANLTTVALIAFLVSAITDASGGPGWLRFETVGFVIVLTWSYVVGYLGLGRLLINFLRRWMFVSLTAGFLFHVILVLAGVGIPMTIQMASRSLRNNDYTLLQMTNAFWTIEELVDHGPAAVEASILVIVIPAFAVAMLLFNMRSVAAELRRHRVAAPVRVIEEEKALHPAPTPGPQNPWEVEEARQANPADA